MDTSEGMLVVADGSSLPYIENQSLFSVENLLHELLVVIIRNAAREMAESKSASAS